MKNMNMIIKNAKSGSWSWRRELNSFLSNYPNTPHITTWVSPAELIFIDNNSSKLVKLAEISNTN